MEKISLRKLSVLGLVLMAASAVTAAVIPDKSDNKRANNNNGTLKPLSNDGGPAVFSCIAEVEDVQSCTATQVTTTSRIVTPPAGEETQSYLTTIDDQYQTSGNTSNTFATPDPGGVDQTSILRKVS